MSIVKEINGDLIKAGLNNEVDYIIHQANCHHIMGAGIAPIIANAFPGTREADEATIKSDRSKLGTYSINTQNKCKIVNLYGQYDIGRDSITGGIPTSYEAIEAGLELLVKNELSLLENKDKIIGIPKFGAGLGGASWEIISGIVNKVLKDYNVHLYYIDLGR